MYNGGLDAMVWGGMCNDDINTELYFIWIRVVVVNVGIEMVLFTILLVLVQVLVVNLLIQ